MEDIIMKELLTIFKEEKSPYKLIPVSPKEPNITIINCENCKYDKCEFYNKSGNSWCPRCKGFNYHDTVRTANGGVLYA